MAANKKTLKKDRVRQLVTTAQDRYGQATAEKKLPILDQLIASLVARRSTHSRAGRCIERMQEEFVDWNEVRVSTISQIASTMGHNEWTYDVAREVRKLLETLYSTEHEVSLDFLRELTPTQTRSYLMKLPNMDRPTADEVMLMSLEIATLPYGEAQARMCRQLGLVEDDRLTVGNQRSLERLFDPKELPPVHYFLSEHSTTVCLPDFGKCEECPLIDYCPAAPETPKA